MERVADEEGMRPRILLEVNVAGEASKHGFSPETLRRDLEETLSLGRLTIEGLMTLPPLAPEGGGPRAVISSRCANCAINWRWSSTSSCRSFRMGMSGDYPIAIEEGATLVRVGTAIFGERSRPKHA